MPEEQEQPKEDFDVRVLSVLRAEGSGPGRTEVRVVSWNGKEPVLEKRQWIFDHAKKRVRPGKCRGLTLKDVSFVVSNWPDVQRAMLEVDA
jgi:hypothetical protein